MRYPKILIGLAAAGLLAAGCGSDGDSSGAGDRPADAGDRPAGSGDGRKALPVAVDGPQEDVVDSSGDAKLKVTPAPENGAPFTQKVEHKLRETVLRGVMVPGETSAECADGVTQKAGAVSQCVVTYEGAEIPYEVKISDKYTEGSMFTFYDTTPKKGLLVAKSVYNTLHERYSAEAGYTGSSKLACEEIPVAKTVDLNSDTGYTCQYWTETANDGEGGYTTLRVMMGVRGPGFEQAG
ncbi:hypothetical protein [Streptomyces cathayae]|uniref:DUF4333 domain-containing protein n=1 Tax=Streptomyces cathayae TaxID=3031124 RepID=A0ABY8K3H2_9ACTN|nr:hypothetical protein [Streptomyces sp. HUAS 5]WGD42159.1 hypothetical protein PYS65_19555 [Streptomyces sp. HUAS 5]